MKTKKEQFMTDLMHEINTLKTLSTDVERSRLNFNDFDPENPTRCIYGQMTGDCRSARAKELIDSCCIRVIDTKARNIRAGQSVDDIEDLINGGYSGQMWGDDGSRKRWIHLSSLEGFIQLKDDAKNSEIIAYIKGELKGLSL